MRLEEEIKQKTFKSEYQKLAVNIIYTHGWLMSIQKEFFDLNGISATQYNILRILRGQLPNPASINLLKERMLDKMSDTSRLVERLRIKGLVYRKTCNNDRRKSDVKITKKGLSLLNRLGRKDTENKNIFKNLKESEMKKLNSLLDKLRG